jgi:hypothetical protein
MITLHIIRHARKLKNMIQPTINQSMETDTAIADMIKLEVMDMKTIYKQTPNVREVEENKYHRKVYRRYPQIQIGLSMMLQICNPSSMGDLGRRISVQA